MSDDDQGIDVLGSLDWPTPLTALAGEALRDGTTCAIDYDTLDMPGHTLHRYLDKKGIETWWWSVYAGQVLFSYRRVDERRLWDALYPPGGLHAPNDWLGGLANGGVALVGTAVTALSLWLGEGIWGRTQIPAAAVAGLGLAYGQVWAMLGGVGYLALGAAISALIGQ